MMKILASTQNPFDIFDSNPWVPDGSFTNDDKRYHELVRLSRFYYRNDPFVSAVINRIAEVGATEVIIDQGNLTDNEYALLEYVKIRLQHYLKNAIRELLLSGLLYTEVTFKDVDSSYLRRIGVRYKIGAQLPSSISFRNPENLYLRSVTSPEDVVYFYKIPERLKDFILSDGVWPDTFEQDKETFRFLKEKYPKLVKAVKEGKDKLQIYPKYEVVRLNTSPDTTYPTPYLAPILPLLRHKRNLRRMDYALAARAIISILHIKVGNDEFPVTKDDEDVLDELRNEFAIPACRQPGDYERIFQLFTNHTVDINWIVPPLEALLNSDKYENVNDEILIGLGFPRSMLVGETKRSQAGNADISNAIVKTILHTIRNDVIIVIRQIIHDIIKLNGFRGRPSGIRLAPFNLVKFGEMVEALRDLYETGNISRDTYLSVIGASFKEEAVKMLQEQEFIKEHNLREYAPVPYSPQPESDNNKGQE